MFGQIMDLGSRQQKVAHVASRIPTLRTELLVLGGFIALALLVRLPTFILPSMNWDEGLFWVIGAEINQGHLPYVTAWDRKPIGLFLIYAFVDRTFSDPFFGLRLVSSLSIAAGAFALYRVGQLAFGDGRMIGLVAGSSFILFSLLNGGRDAASEVFYVPLTVIGLILLIKPMVEAPNGKVSGRAWWFFAGGLTLGLAFQIKYSAIFDMIGFAVAYFVLLFRGGEPLPALLGRAVPPLAMGALGAVLPTLAVMAVYASQGAFEAFLAANVVANAGYGDEPMAPITTPLVAILKHGPLWFAAGLALILAPRIARHPPELRMVAALAVWSLCILAGIAYLRMRYHGYFFQMLPPLCLLTGYVLARGVVEQMNGAGAKLLSLSLIAVTTFFATAKPLLLIAGYFALERVRHGDPLMGDNVARIARDLEAELGPDEAIYVYDYHPALYYLLERQPPTPFALPDHLLNGAYGLVDPQAELAGILQRRPEYIVTRVEARPDAHGGEAETGSGQARVVPADDLAKIPLERMLQGVLDQAYELDSFYPPILVRGESEPVLAMARWGARIYRHKGGRRTSLTDAR